LIFKTRVLRGEGGPPPDKNAFKGPGKTLSGGLESGGSTGSRCGRSPTYGLPYDANMTESQA
jgi:hypothetical protein